jgi:glucuronate isomerase
MPNQFQLSTAQEKEFATLMTSKKVVSFSQPDAFLGTILLELCKMYWKKGWVQQFYLGPIRNNNTKLLKLIGADAGTDSIGDYPQAVNLLFLKMH